MTGPLHLYVGWQEMEQKLRAILPQDASSQIAMEYSPRGAIPYVSKVDAGTLEMVRANTRASVVSSADLVQLVQAVLSSQQMESHRRAAAHMSWRPRTPLSPSSPKPCASNRRLPSMACSS